ncbi:MAG: tetratricopeptide repeat protein [Opitutaceae bacterium]|nr:tetratricopeptide repeat protein [Cytophagales bacterium]
MRLFIHILIFLFALGSAFSQDLDLANEYFQKEDYSKARVHYELAIKKRVPLLEVYPKYASTLIKIGDLNEADRFFKKIIKAEPYSGQIKVDYLVFLKDSKSKDYDKTLVKIQKEAIQDDANFPSLVYYLNSLNQQPLLESFITAFRKTKGNTAAFYKEMANAKKMQGNLKEMSEELLLGLLEEEEQTEEIKHILQNYLTEPTELDYFKSVLLEVAQNDPQNTTISELLLWIFIQQRDFASAAIHAKAIDKKQRNQGDNQKEVADLAVENKNYDAAINIYASLIKDYPNSSTSTFAKGKSIMVREVKIKSKFPVNRPELTGLISDYKALIKEAENTGNTNSYKYKSDMAMLYGFYLEKLDSAILILNSAIQQSQFDKKFQSQARLNLGDLYLLDNQPWESTLLYSQVEALERDQLLGHEAKLKNAKLNYYAGEFTLAQEQMDVLKLATSREISNDAIQLSVLIQDNITEDTTGYALKKFSAIELLIFQNKWEAAKKQLEELYGEYRANSLKDDILMLEAKISKQFGEFDKAIEKFDLLLANHGEDILADDAAFQIAQLYDYNLKNPTKAMEYYNKVITKFPASILVVESRKRFRELRGDKVN